MSDLATILGIGDDMSDWAEVFAEPDGDGRFYASSFGAMESPDVVPPGAAVDGSWFSRRDVAEVLHLSEGEHDERDWIFVGRLSDGRFASVVAGCDYTGWG